MNRYPGTQPFTADQKHLFCGRAQETEDLMKLIRFQQMVVLYGKSGLGKSSLLNASVKPKIEEQKIADVFSIRFNAHTDDEETPLSKTFAALMPNENTPLSPLADATLWYAAKARQLATQKQHFLLVFDQFEELFTYNDTDVQAFKEALTELMRAGLPKRWEDKIKMAALSEDDLDTIYETADVKILFSIRSDRMHLLDKLSDVLPDILRHCYELKALSENDAKDAIIKPADTEGSFSTPRFSYDVGALQNIITFLKDDEERIEAIQLQTLCQAFEKTITVPNQIIATADTPDDKLKAIIDDYYKTQIADARVTDKHTAQRLIEDELVIETGDGKGVRVTLHELSVLAKFARQGQNEDAEKLRLKTLLDALVNVHLLRREVGSRGGDTYELSHDRLIEPVLKNKKVYVAEIEKQRVERELKERADELAEAKKRADEAEEKRQEAEKLRAIAVQQQEIAEKQRKRASLFTVASVLALAVAVWFYIDATAAKNKSDDRLKQIIEAQNQRKKMEADKLINEAEIDIKAEQYYFAKIKLDSATALNGRNDKINGLIKLLPK